MWSPEQGLGTTTLYKCKKPVILSENFKTHEIYKIDASHDNGIDITKRADFFSKRS